MDGKLTRQGILRQEDDYYIIRQPMPYPPGESNSYLIKTNDGWAVLDVGVDIPGTRQIWEQALYEVGISFENINYIYITHCHPDHLGAAAWLQQKSEAPVYMLEEEIRRAEKYFFIEGDIEDCYRQIIENKVLKSGFAPELLTGLVKVWHEEVIALSPRPEVILPLNKDQKIDLAGEKFEIIRSSAHADGQYILWSEKRSHIFSADSIGTQVYLYFYDWPNSELKNPLADLFHSIDILKELGDVKLFPGHGNTFSNLNFYLQALQERHEKMLDKILRLVDHAMSPAEIYPQMYKLVDYVHLHRVVMGETLGYLKYLTNQGKMITCDDGQNVRFCPRNI